MSRFHTDKSLDVEIDQTALRLRQGLQRAFAAGGYEITTPQWALLNRLCQEEGLCQSELAERTLRDKATVARMLGILDARGIVRRRPGQEDRRHREVYLTSKGKVLRDKLAPIAAAYLGKASEGLTDGRIRDLMGTLKRIASNLDVLRMIEADREGNQCRGSGERRSMKKRWRVQACKGEGTAPQGKA